MNSVHAPVDWSNRASLPPFHSATQMLSNGSMHAPYGAAALVGIRCVAALRVAGSYMLIAPLNIQCTQILPCESTSGEHELRIRDQGDAAGAQIDILKEQKLVIVRRRPLEEPSERRKNPAPRSFIRTRWHDDLEVGA